MPVRYFGGSGGGSGPATPTFIYTDNPGYSDTIKTIAQHPDAYGIADNGFSTKPTFTESFGIPDSLTATATPIITDNVGISDIPTVQTLFPEAVGGSDSCKFVLTYLSVGSFNFVVPTGVTAVTLDLFGGNGGGSSVANAGRTQGTITTTPGETLQVNVGGAGGASGAAGSNGGGAGGTGAGAACGGGGGATDIRQGGTALANRVAIAPGGGGRGGNGTGGQVGGAGGAGGATTGSTGTAGTATVGSGGGGGGGGTPSTGGSAGSAGTGGAVGSVGTSGTGGAGAAASGTVTPGGGGGGGLFGGGGGGSGVAASAAGGGGGGGSALVPGGGSTTGNTSGGNSNNGKAILTFTL